MKKEFKLIVEVDEKKLRKNYPTWSINFNTPDDFITSVAYSLSENKRKYGYRIMVKLPDKEKSSCCNADLIDGVQCETCGADARIVKLGNYNIKLWTKHNGKKQIIQCLEDELKAGHITKYEIE